MKLLQILPSDEIHELTLDVTQMKDVAKALKEHSETQKTQPKKLYSWESEGCKILCYGWYKGKAGNENKHELLPNGTRYNVMLDSSDTQLLFGPVFLLKQTTKLGDLTTGEYGEFYSLMIGGIDDCSDDSYEESEGSEGSLHEFIVDDEVSETPSLESEECIATDDSDDSDEIDESEMVLDSDEELEEDTYAY